MQDNFETNNNISYTFGGKSPNVTAAQLCAENFMFFRKFSNNNKHDMKVDI